MSLLSNSFRRAIVLVILSSSMVPVAAFAGHGGGNHRSLFSQQRSAPRPTVKANVAKLNNTQKVIPFPNGNKGISGLGMPQKKTAIPLPNGKLGISGLGMPQQLSPSSTTPPSNPPKEPTIKKLVGRGLTGDKLAQVADAAHKPLFDPIHKLKVKPTKDTNTPPTTNDPPETTPPTDNKDDRGSRFGNFGNILNTVLSNLQMGGGGGGDDGGGGGGGGEAAPAEEPAQQQTADYEPPQPVVADSGSVDLVLEDAHKVEEATKLAGPAYSIRFRNQGLAASTRFSVAAVTSSDGQYRDDAPRAMLDVPGLAAGEMREVVLRLPRGESDYLILLVDATGAVEETDKDNNSAVIERAAL